MFTRKNTFPVLESLQKIMMIGSIKLTRFTDLTHSVLQYLNARPPLKVSPYPRRLELCNHLQVSQISMFFPFQIVLPFDFSLFIMDTNLWYLSVSRNKSGPIVVPFYQNSIDGCLGNF